MTYISLITGLSHGFLEISGFMIWNRADKLVCVSKALKTYYSKWFPESKLEVICNGIAEIDSSFTPEYDVIQSVENFHSIGLKVIGQCRYI